MCVGGGVVGWRLQDPAPGQGRARVSLPRVQASPTLWWPQGAVQAEGSLEGTDPGSTHQVWGTLSLSEA